MNIDKLSFNNPNANLMIIKNTFINNKTIFIDSKLKNKIFLPTMYKNWNNEQNTHVKFKVINNIKINKKNKNILFLFDTWGCSSYYHLLIDHIIPLKITLNIIKNKLDIDNYDINYYEISNNYYNNELKNKQDIFKYFFGKNYLNNIKGEFDYIIYGYLFTYRPYIKFDLNIYPNYKIKLNEIRNIYLNKKNKKDIKSIIICKRHNRCNNIFINKLYIYLKNYYNIRFIDFSDYSIDEQISICNESNIMIGYEGAAFANMIFLNKNSIIIIFIKKEDYDHIYFQYYLAIYLDHKIFIYVDDGNILKKCDLNDIKNICN